MSNRRSVLGRLTVYMEKKKILLPLSIILSGLSTISGLAPFIFIWLIVSELFAGPELSQNQISTYAWWATGTAVTSLALYFLALTSSHLAAFRVETNMRRFALKKLVNTPLGFFDNNTGGRVRKIIDDNAGVTHSFLAHQLPDLAGTVLTPLIVLSMILFFDWRLGLACIVPIIAAIAIMAYMMSGIGKTFMMKYMDSLEEMNTEAVEYVRGIPVVKVFQQTVYSFKSFYASILKYKDMVSQYTNNWENPMSIYTVIIHGFIFFLVPVSILIMGRSGNYVQVLTDLLLYVLVTPLFATGIMRSMYINRAFMEAGQAIDRMENLTGVSPLPEAGNPLSIKSYDIEFKNVFFKYPGANQNAVDGVSFKIPQGKTYALVGPSGSGKTTIARLIPRFWDTTQGDIAIGGANVKDIASKELMNNVSFVFQNTKLFKTTLLENIKYGKPDASPAEIDKALELSRSREIIQRLPLGLDTKIGAEGTYLSGGEQQRIALARAILKDAPIVVLDEATAFADPENEHLIQKALRELMKGKTALMIAHRLTTVKNVDTILVVNEGKIIERGTHEQLVENQGLYSEMWREYQKAVKWTIKKEARDA